MNEDMKKTIDHAYEVLGIDKKTIEKQLLLGDKEKYITERYNNKYNEIENNPEMSEEEKEKAFKNLKATATIAIIEARGGNLLYTSDMSVEQVTEAENYAKKYQEKQTKNKKEITNKKIRDLLKSLGREIPENIKDKDGNIIEIDPSQWEKENFKAIIESLSIKQVLETGKKNGEGAEQLLDNLSLLEKLSNLEPNERIEECYKTVAKNTIVKAEPIQQTQERPKNRFVEWLKKKLQRKATIYRLPNTGRGLK